MSIQDNNDQEIVKLPGFWSVIFKLAAVGTIALAGTMFTWGVWITTTVWKTSERVAILEWQTSHASKGGNQTTSVNVGAVDSKEIDEAPELRGYYTTSEIAALLKKSERTVQDMCAHGQIAGATQPKNGRGWRIPLAFSLSGKLPQTAAISEPPPDEEAEACP